jgi:hypothetical protein
VRKDTQSVGRLSSDETEIVLPRASEPLPDESNMSISYHAMCRFSITTHSCESAIWVASAPRSCTFVVELADS